MARKIVVTSGKGGVGKTTTVANLGLKLAGLGARVCLIDTDIGLNNLDVVLGLDTKVIYDLCDVLENRCRLKQALVQDTREPLLYLLPSNHIYSSKIISSFNIKKVVDELSEFFDFVIIDCPAGIDKGFHRAVSCADEAIVITTPHMSSVRDADKVLNLLNSYTFSAVSCIVNRVRGDLILKGDMIDVLEITNLLHTNLIGVVPEDDKVNCALNNALFSEADNAYLVLAQNILHNENTIYDYKQKYKGFIGKIKRLLKGAI